VPHGWITADIARWRSDIYTVSSGDHLECRGLGSGAVRWRFRSGFRGEPTRWSQPPAVAAGKVFFGGLDGTLYALDAASGRVDWKHQTGTRISTAVTAIGDTIYFGTADGHLYRLRVSDGTVLADLKIQPTPVSDPAAAGDSLLYFLDPGGGAGTTNTQTLVCLDSSLTAVVWRNSSSRWTSNRPYVWHGMVLAGSADGEVAAFRVRDGARGWTFKLGGLIKSISGDERALYIGTYGGMIYGFHP
jgi:hypothetical protein